jgi:hypothetical protein
MRSFIDFNNATTGSPSLVASISPSPTLEDITHWILLERNGADAVKIGVLRESSRVPGKLSLDRYIVGPSETAYLGKDPQKCDESVVAQPVGSVATADGPHGFWTREPMTDTERTFLAERFGF